MTYDIGIDLGGTNIVAGLVDESGRILAKANTPTSPERPWQEIVEDMAEMSRQAAAAVGVDFREIGHVGVGIPGIANKDSGVAEFVTNLYWHDVPLVSALSEALKKPIYIENDANAAAFGEYLCGAGGADGILLAVTLGTGIGGGLIIGGSIYTGFNYAGMEVGHMVIHRGGRPCTCGRAGCFERYASATGLITTTKEWMARDRNSLLWALVAGDIEQVNGKISFDAAARGDETAIRVIDSYVHDLACGIASLINIFQPNILCLGGGISNQGDVLITPLRALVYREIYSRESKHNTEIVRAKLGNDAGIIGAAQLHRAKVS